MAKQSGSEKRRLPDFVRSNATWGNGELAIEFCWPPDLIARFTLHGLQVRLGRQSWNRKRPPEWVSTTLTNFSTPQRCGTLLQNTGQNSLSHSASAQGSAPAEWPEIRDLILGCEDLPLIVREMIVRIGDDQYETFPGVIQDCQTA